MSLTTQWTTLSLMLASGALLGLFIDFYRVVARRFALRGWPITIFDLLFWLLAACFVFSILLWSNWGEMRFYIMLAIIAGILVYLRFFTRPVTKFLAIVLNAAEQLIKSILRIGNVLIVRPVIWLALLIWRITWAIAKFLLTILTKPLLWAINPIISFCRPYLTKWKKIWPSRKKGDDDLE